MSLSPIDEPVVVNLFVDEKHRWKREINRPHDSDGLFFPQLNYSVGKLLRYSTVFAGS